MFVCLLGEPRIGDFPSPAPRGSGIGVVKQWDRWLPAKHDLIHHQQSVYAAA